MKPAWGVTERVLQGRGGEETKISGGIMAEEKLAEMGTVE
jgi:hypothetical protein